MRQQCRISKFAMVAFALSAYAIFLVITKSPPRRASSQKSENEDFLAHASPKLRKAITDWRKCIKENFNEADTKGLWSALTSLVNGCVNNTALGVIMNKAFAAPNDGEVKYHVMAKTNTSAAVVVTLGVGKDINAEQHLMKILPEGSEFFGTDPNYDENNELFQTIGKFFPFAVAATTGTYTARVYRNGSYYDAQLTHISLVTFLRDIVNRTRIDQLLMDNEYAEYDLLPQFTRAAELDAAAIQVCQLNTEMHLLNENKERAEKFVKIVKQILHGNRWLPLFVESTHHHHVFLVNYEDEYCRETYLEQFFA